MQRIRSAKTIEEAKELVIEGVHLDEFDTKKFEVLDEPSKGFLGIGSKEARVKLIVKTDKVAKAKFLLKEMLTRLGIKSKFESSFKQEDNQLIFHLSGEEANSLRGSLGRSAHKLEFLLNNMVNRKDREDYLKTVLGFEGQESLDKDRKRLERKSSHRTSRSDEKNDREQTGPRTAKSSSREPNRERKDRTNNRSRGYDKAAGFDRSDHRENRSGGSNAKPHRERFLINMARKMAQQVLETHKTVHLNPMNSYDRRIIHTELNETEHISTSSDGEGDRRHVVIQYQE